MELSKKLEQALNEQVRLELESSYIYNGMRLYLKKRGIPGATSWMTNQMHEEQEHAEDFINLLIQLDGNVELGDIKKQTTEYDSVLAVFEAGLAHEKTITASIEKLLELAIKEKHYAVENFLRHYINEQVEEEDNFRGIIDMFKLAGNNEAAFFKVDSILGKRGK